MLIKIEDNQPVGTPVLEDNFRYLHPEVAFPLVFTPEIVEPYGYGMYDFTQIPEVGPYQKLVEGTPIKDQYNIWRQVWQVVPLEGAELAERKAKVLGNKLQELQALRDRKIQLGGYKVGTKWFHSDTFSRSQQLGLARKADKVEASGGDLDTPFAGTGPGGFLYWKSMDGTFVPMTPRLAQKIFDAAEAQDIAMFSYAEMLRAQLEAAEDPLAVDITANWPPTYQDENP